MTDRHVDEAEADVKDAGRSLSGNDKPNDEGSARRFLNGSAKVDARRRHIAAAGDAVESMVDKVKEALHVGK
jgi:hypothetical protein